MWPDLVSNQGPLTYESGALPTALRGPASDLELLRKMKEVVHKQRFPGGHLVPK